jgi:fibro-slime domain-containing protein
MRIAHKIGFAIASAVLLSAVSASASTVQIDWYSVSPSFPDFNLAACGIQNCSQNFNNEVGTSLLGGRPVVSAGNPAGLSEAVGTQLQWWTPQTGVAFQGTTFQALPINQNMFVPLGTGSSDSSAFQTAIISATIHVGVGGGTITFGGDDDMFLALNNSVVDQVGGIHPASGINAIYNVAAGDYVMDVFYADRHVTDAHAFLNVGGNITTAVPEPSTWAMMILGFFGVGFLAYRRTGTRTTLRWA